MLPVFMIDDRRNANFGHGTKKYTIKISTVFVDQVLLIFIIL